MRFLLGGPRSPHSCLSRSKAFNRDSIDPGPLYHRVSLALRQLHSRDCLFELHIEQRLIWMRHHFAQIPGKPCKTYILVYASWCIRNCVFSILDWPFQAHCAMIIFNTLVLRRPLWEYSYLFFAVHVHVILYYEPHLDITPAAFDNDTVQVAAVFETVGYGDVKSKICISRVSE